jgi:hypothetical protein
MCSMAHTLKPRSELISGSVGWLEPPYRENNTTNNKYATNTSELLEAAQMVLSKGACEFPKQHSHFPNWPRNPRAPP